MVLTDFGIATLAGDAAISGMLAGSPGSIAPERLKGDDDRPESDLWSLGAPLYTAAEGRPPYARDRPTAVLAAVLLHEPEPMRLAGPLAPVLAGLLEKDPGRRMSADQAAWQLRAVVFPGPAGAAPQHHAPRLHPRPPLATGPAATAHHRSQIVYLKNNLTVTVFCTLQAAGYARPDRAVKSVARSLDALL